jgi:hypothetical protein
VRLVRGSETSPASAEWCFTYHFKSKRDTKNKFLKVLRNPQGFMKYHKEILISKEHGKRGGTPHLQGFITFNRPLNLFNYKGICIPNEIHLEKMRGSIDENIRYVCGIDKPWQIGKIVLNEGIPRYRIPKPVVDRSIIPVKDLYEYQRKAYNILTGVSEPRTIYWFWEANGNTGKSSFCKTMVRMQEAFYLGDTGTATDIHHAIRKVMENRRGKIDFKKYPKAFVLDLSRTGRPDYKSIERVKNGLFFSPKYDSTYVYGEDYPSVVVFSNNYPDITKLSKDRWRIFRILPTKQCIEEVLDTTQ